MREDAIRLSSGKGSGGGGDDDIDGNIQSQSSQSTTLPIPPLDSKFRSTQIILDIIDNDDDHQIGKL